MLVGFQSSNTAQPSNQYFMRHYVNGERVGRFQVFLEQRQCCPRSVPRRNRARTAGCFREMYAGQHDLNTTGCQVVQNGYEKEVSRWIFLFLTCFMNRMAHSR